MDTYGLAKLIASVESVDSRKRLQKCVYLLQLCGCDLGADYRLHYYGPYSRDVADAVDLLAQSDILDESSTPSRMGERYSYRIKDHGQLLLANYEATDEGEKALERIEPFVSRFQQLNGMALRTLELASTIAFYYNSSSCSTWEEAQAKAAEFKRVRTNSTVLTEAGRIAKEFDKAA